MPLGAEACLQIAWFPAAPLGDDNLLGAAPLGRDNLSDVLDEAMPFEAEHDVVAEAEVYPGLVEIAVAEVAAAMPLGAEVCLHISRFPAAPLGDDILFGSALLSQMLAGPSPGKPRVEFQAPRGDRWPLPSAASGTTNRRPMMTDSMLVSNPRGPKIQATDRGVAVAATACLL